MPDLLPIVLALAAVLYLVAMAMAGGMHWPQPTGTRLDTLSDLACPASAGARFPPGVSCTRLPPSSRL
jgi:hypothetical protein